MSLEMGRPDSGLRRLDSQTTGEKFAKKIETIAPFALKELDANRFKMGDFTEYPAYKDSVRNDMQETLKMMKKQASEQAALPAEERKKQKQGKELALIAQVAIMRGVGKEKWLGDNAYVKATSQFDDIFRGMDLTVELTDKNAQSSHLGLGVDVSYARDIDKKFTRIHKEMNAGVMGKIKYFKSHDGTFTGELPMVPKVIVGVDAKRLERILATWSDEGGRSELREPAVQAGVLEEIRMQLEAFEKYARSIKQNALASAYKRDLSIIEKIIERKSLKFDLKELENDNVFASIKQNLERFKVEPVH